MGREPDDYDITTPEDRITRALMRVAESQQPFNQSLLNQMQAVERRLGEQGADLSEMKESMAVIVNQDLFQKMEVLSTRISTLEQAENIRKGLMLATTLAPKIIMGLVIVVAGILAYLKLPNAPPIIH